MKSGNWQKAGPETTLKPSFPFFRPRRPSNESYVWRRVWSGETFARCLKVKISLKIIRYIRYNTIIPPSRGIINAPLSLSLWRFSRANRAFTDFGISNERTRGKGRREGVEPSAASPKIFNSICFEGWRVAGWKIYFTHCVNNASGAHTHTRTLHTDNACVCVRVQSHQNCEY